ncbi:hypothetical protein ACOMHN_018250 [Nucella lapillus]
MRLNRVGARTQPYFTPLHTGKGSDVSPLSCTMTIMLSWNWRTTAMNILGCPYFTMILQRPSLLTVPKSLGQIDKGGEEAGILFLALLLELSRSKHHADSPAFPDPH